MTLAVTYSLDTGNVILLDAKVNEIYEFLPDEARELAADLRSAAESGDLILVVATASDGRRFQIGGNAKLATGMAESIERNADLAAAVLEQLSE